LLKDKGLLPELSSGIDDVVFAFSSSQRAAAAQVAQSLRASGRAVELVLEKRKVKWLFKRADRLGAEHVYLVAPDEWAEGTVRRKTLASGEEQNVPIEDLGLTR